jgi:hypothetical protein
MTSTETDFSSMSLEIGKMMMMIVVMMEKKEI